MDKVDLYITQFKPEIQSRLATLRQLFFDTVPQVEESIRYNMPAYKVEQHHLYFAAYKKHIGFYPVYGLTEIEEEFAPYRAKETKGSLHFPHNKPLPIDLIKKIIVMKSQVATSLSKDILDYNNSQTTADKAICELLAQEICKYLFDAENKVWHRHPVWFLDGNPITGYSKQKSGIRLMFWSGADFEEEKLSIRGKKFKDASIFYSSVDEVNTEELKRWLEKSRAIQWDYKNIVKRKGVLEKLK